MLKQRGFTLIELVIVIAIIAIISVVTTKMLVQGLTGMLTAQNVVDANWQGQLAIERMSRDIRMIRSSGDITTNTSNDLAFTDINGNSVEYKLTGTDLMRNTQILANGVNTLTFIYKDKNGNTIGGTADGMYINMMLTITQKNANYTLGTAVYLRDLSS